MSVICKINLWASPQERRDSNQITLSWNCNQSKVARKRNIEFELSLELNIKLGT